ncbi:MAG: hypothetical protein J6D29_06840 [Solobacterium sp.]|nr:hypothetical protein [Solobacterium sp.]
MSKERTNKAVKPNRNSNTHPRSSTPHQVESGMNRVLLFALLGLSIITVLAFLINMARIALQKNTTSTPSEETAAVETMSSDTGVSMRNDMYSVGNNPTDLQQEYFQKLTDAIKSQDKAAIAEAVVYNFVSDYFTWTNKDGNYEVGGLQYIYTPDIAGFEQWSRYNFYKDLDLYISQKGREKLIEVQSITTSKPVEKAPDFAVTVWDDPQTKREIKYESYEVNVTWEYTNSSDANSFPTGARFFVIDNDGRLEIAEFYDVESIKEWEASQSATQG